MFQILSSFLLILYVQVQLVLWFVELSDVICDIVETGSTLRENGLTVLEEVCDLSARVVVNQVSMRMENERITKLIYDLKDALNED